MNVHVPEEFGGLGASHVEGILIAEELAWGCSGLERRWKPMDSHKHPYWLVEIDS